MEKPARKLTQWIGIILGSALLGIIVLANVVREGHSGDGYFIFIRWPLWVMLGVGVPFVIVRVLFWRKRRRRAEPDQRMPMVE